MRRESIWIATTDEPGFGQLDEPIDVDVAVLGAGIAGLSTALLLENAGVRVAVVEARGVCRRTIRRLARRARRRTSPGRTGGAAAG